MPARRRRTGTRSPQIPIRIKSYQAMPDAVSASSSAPTKSFNRSIVLAQLRTSHKRDICQNTPAVSQITTDHLSLTLPIPPSINKHYATVNGRRLLSSAGRAYKEHVGQQVWLALAQSPVRMTLMDRLQSGPLALSVRFFFTTALRRDLDSGLKIAQDAICEGLGLNDNRIIETHLYKHVDKQHPRIEVSLALAPNSCEPIR